MMSDPNNNNNNSQYKLANNGSSLQRPTTNSNSAINNNDTNVPIISQLNSIVSVPDNSNINNNSNINDRFSSLDSSPYLSDHSNTISIASLNVRGINNNTKFDAIFEDLLDRSFSIIGLQETKISEVRASSHFKDLATRNRTASTFKNYWDFHDSDRAAGVGIIIAPFISKFVQKVHRHLGRFIAVDLYLPSKKLKFINIYVPPMDSYVNKGKDLITFIIDHIRTSEAQGFQCIIIGDFNVDPFKYHQLLEQGSSIPRYYQLIAFLTDNNYIDQSPKDISGKDFATFVSSTTNLRTSRIDLLWYPDSMIRNTFCFDQVWTLPSTKFSLILQPN